MNYPFLWKSNRGKSVEAACIESGSDMREHLIVRKAKAFYDYGLYADGIDRLYADIQADGNIYDYHEVIFDRPQKLKFDLDVKDEIPPGDLIDVYTEAILDTFFQRYFLQCAALIDESAITVYTSSDDKRDPPYYSYHIIVNGYYVKNSAEANAFTTHMIDLLPSTYIKYIDTGVNKSTQNFRILGSTKDKRTKRLYNGDPLTIDAFKASLIMNTMNTKCKTSTELPALVASTVRAPGKLLEIDSVLMMVSKHGYDTGLEFYKVIDNMLIYRRIAPSHCALCNRTHDHENSLIVFTNVTECKISVNVSCRRSGEQKFLGTVEITENAIGAVAREITRVKSGQYYEPRLLFYTLPSNQIDCYNEPNMRMFNTCSTLVVKADMRMGKTKRTKEWLDRTLANNDQSDERAVTYISVNSVRMSEEESRIIQTIIDELHDCVEQHVNTDDGTSTCLIITPRRTLSLESRRVYGSEFEFHEAHKGHIDMRQHPRMISSTESVDKFIGNAPPDVLVLDECESIFEQVCSGLSRNMNKAVAAFEWALKYARRVILLDANISNRTYRILQKIRPDPTMQFHCNEFKRSYTDNYRITSDFNAILCEMVKSLRNGKNIVFASNSVNQAENVKAFMDSQFNSTLDILLYTSRTSEAVKREHFTNVSDYWSVPRLLIYTPTVTAGISFEEEHYDELFAYFTDESCCVEVCRQMIARVRRLRDDRYTICIKARPSFTLTTINAIRDELYRNRASLRDTPEVPVEITKNGAITYYDSGYFRIWLENRLIRNLSLANFMGRFIYQVHSRGSTVTALEFERDAEYMEISSKYTDISGDVRTDAIYSIIDANEIVQEEAASIAERLSNGDQVSDADINALERYRLRRHYAYEKEIGKNFVEVYSKPNVKAVFSNLNAMRNFQGKVTDLLEDIRKLECKIHEDMKQSELRDLTHNFRARKHMNAVKLIDIFGFITDYELDTTRLIKYSDFEARLRDQYKEFRATIPILAYECKRIPFPPKLTDSDFPARMMKFFNAVIGPIYDMRIQKRKPKFASESSFVLRVTNKFIMNPSPDDIRPEFRLLNTESIKREPILTYEQVEEQVVSMF